MLNRSLIGKKYPKIIFKVERQKLKLFATATGQSDPIYFSKASALEKGYRDIIAPPTFITVLGMEQKPPHQYLKDLKIPIGKVLHAGQKYEYYDLIYPKDTLTMEIRIGNIYDKKKGKLEFFELEFSYVNQKNILVAEAVSTLVVR